MGQAQSKRSSVNSDTPLNTASQGAPSSAYDSFSPQASDPTSPIPFPESSITRPADPQTLNRISALIDPQDFFNGYAAQAIHPFPTTYTSNESNSDGRHREDGNSPRRKQNGMLIESPSGRLLDTNAYLAHPNRPLTIRERQEFIKQALEKAESEKPQPRPRSSRLAKSSLNLGSVKEHWSGSRPGSKHNSGAYDETGRQSRSESRNQEKGHKVRKSRSAEEEKKRGCLGGLFR